MIQAAPSLPITLTDRLACTIEAIRCAVAAWGAKNRAAAPIIVLLWGRFGHIVTRFTALVAQVRAGRVPAQRVTRRADGPAPPRDPPSRPTVELPRGFAWLLRLVPETRSLAGQVRHWLTDPELKEILAAAPQAGRLLRPLCHMLGIEPGPALALPRPERRAAPVQEPAVSDAPAAPERGSPPERESDLRIKSGDVRWERDPIEQVRWDPPRDPIERVRWDPPPSPPRPPEPPRQGTPPGKSDGTGTPSNEFDGTRRHGLNSSLAQLTDQELMEMLARLSAKA